MKFFQNLKKTLVWTLSVLFVAIVLFGVYFAVRDFSAGKKSDGVISVAGECNGTAAQDKFAITLNVVVLDHDAAASLSHAQETADAVILFAQGIKDDAMSVQTARMNSYEKTQWNNKEEKSVVLGTETTIAITVSTKSMDNIKYILTNLSRFSDVKPENLQITTSTETMKIAMEKCIIDAVRNARARANIIAAAEGGRVGKLISLEYGETASGSPARPLRGAVMAMAKSDGAGLSAGATEFSISVNASFELK
ncbi:MAG: SIMPL domain-containing protein [Rickettsiales bacterium]|jgi:uncharacterized protein YggE|nr:SIMPL domain-containing protein [Rickettsiales bacterium]